MKQLKTMNLQPHRLTVDDCIKNAKKITNTNPRYKHFAQSMFTAGDIDQFNQARVKKSLTKRENPDLSNNLFKTAVFPDVWKKYKNLSSEAVNNTFLYLFNKFKKGLFVRIVDNKLECFIPFSNAHYYNEFGDLIVINPKYSNVEVFLEYVASLQKYKLNQKVRPVNEWFANNSLLRYDYTEMDHNTSVLYDLLSTLCNERKLPDIEFFINRRDFPQFRKDGTEPYDQIFGKRPLLSHVFDQYSPLISFSGNSKFADVLMPTYEDWSRAVYQDTNSVFLHECKKYPEIEQTKWQNKIAKAVFRGSTTGVGVSNGRDGKPAPVNQRLLAYQISQENSNASVLDFGITKWNIRPRKLHNYKYLETIEPQNGSPSYQLANRLTLQQQSQYKYILNLEGNVAAYRLSYELSSGSVVLLAGSKWKMWYYKLLIPYTHYVPVQENLDDLITQINWCIENDDRCKNIALNAKQFYDKYLGVNGILDFWQAHLWYLSQFTGVYDYFPNLSLAGVIEESRLFQLENQPISNVYSNQLIQSLNIHRCMGLLGGMMKIFKNKVIMNQGKFNHKNKLFWIKQVFKSTNSAINLFTIHGFKLVGKTGYNDIKILENYHESFIGINTINSLVAKLPHFCYVFGPILQNNQTVFLEYINGVTLFQWLKSPLYNFKQLISILVQINLALLVAQNSVGFVHNDLYPWNIVVASQENLFCAYTDNKQERHNEQIHYYVSTETVLTMTPELIPVLIDYGKSRTIVFEEEYGLIDHSFTNKYRHGQLLDTFTLLYSVLDVLRIEKKLTDQELNLLQFPKHLGLNDFNNIQRWSKFSALFDFTSNPNSPRLANRKYVTPKHFVDFILTSTRPESRPIIHKINLTTKKFNYIMENGPNPLFVEQFLKTGNRISALYEVVKHVNYSKSLPQNMFFTKIQQLLLNRHLLWLNTEFYKPETPTWLQKQWTTVCKIFNLQSSIKYTQPTFKIQPPEEIFFNEHVSPEIFKNIRVELDTKDWITILDVLVDTFLFQETNLLNLSFIRACNENRFEILNRISSHCTINKLHQQYINEQL